MKTNTIVLSSPLPHSIPHAPGLSRFSKLGRGLLPALCFSLVSFAAAPLVQAAKPNGTYDVKKVKGSIRFADNKVDIPDKIMKRIVRAADGDITIRHHSLRLKKKATIEIAEDLGDRLNLDVTASVTGPSSVKLDPSGDNYSGSTSRPIVTSFEANVFGVDFHGKLKTRVSTTVVGRTLTVTIRFSGDAVGADFGGRVIIIAKR